MDQTLTETMDLSWVDFYTKFADELLKYKTDRNLLVEKFKKIFSSLDLNFPRIEQDDSVYDLDPFTIFGFFNTRNRIERRKAIIGCIIKEFEMDAKIPEAFDSTPLFHNQMTVLFARLPDRGDSDIDNLWILFEAALAYSNSQSEENRTDFIQVFNAVIKQACVKFNITMALYWIRPYTFIGLDGKNRAFFQNPAEVPQSIRSRLPDFKDVPDGKTYLDITDMFKTYFSSSDSKYKSFPEISYAAWKQPKKKGNKDNGFGDPEQITNALSDVETPKKKYWTYIPGEGASKWEEFYDSGIMGFDLDKLGDYREYESKEELKEKMLSETDGKGKRSKSVFEAWQFCHDIQVGDVIYAKKGRSEILGRGIVSSDYIYDETRSEIKNIRKVDWQQKGSWKLEERIGIKPLREITRYPHIIEKIEAFFDQDEVQEDEDEKEDSNYLPYSREDFLEDVFMDERNYDQIVNTLKWKKNIILQGPPGVGKTYAAKRLAYSMMGVKNFDRVVMIQFHQSYSYEDFIMGFRPSQSGFELKKGSFYEFCRLAEEDLDNDYFFIIDEINRGNLSKIFGELFMLLENDKRGIDMRLLYSNELFTIPKNVHIIGMMNTADRSLAIMDYALRRRFAFIDMVPGFDTEGFKAYQESLQDDSFERLVSVITELNREIDQDEMLGAGYQIGHSFLCDLQGKDLESVLSSIVELELIPLLKEYWFDDPYKVKTWSDKLRRSIQ